MFGHFHLVIYTPSFWWCFGKQCAQALQSHLAPCLYTAYVVIGAIAGAANLLLLAQALLLSSLVLLLAQIRL